MAFSVPIVLARCAARLQYTKKLWIDDWTALLGMVLLTGLAAVEYISSRMGFGSHYWNVGVGNGVVLLQMFYVAQLLYIAIQVTAKVSIACLFIRIFPARWIRLTLKIFIAFMIGHGFAFIMVIIFQCWPINSIWDKTVAGTCVDVTVVGFVGAGISIAEDILLIVVPIVELRKLKVTISQKIVLILIFATASFAMVTSMIRLKYLAMFANTFDSTWDNVDVIIWSLIELLTAVFLGSLPPLRPWINKGVPRISDTWNQPSGNSFESNDLASTVTADDKVNSKHGHSGSLPVYDSNRTKTASFAVSAISSVRSSMNTWRYLPDSPLHIPTSKFQDSAVSRPGPNLKRWSQQPDSPTDPNVLHKCMSIYLTKMNSHDLESNISRDTWSTRDTWTLGAVERLSSKFAGRPTGQ